MSNSDSGNTITGLNKVLRDIGRTPEIFRRDTPLLLKLLRDLESTSTKLEKLPSCKNQAE